MAEKDQDVETLEFSQSMIDIFAERLVGLRTQCSTSNELTQSEIRTLEVNKSLFLCLFEYLFYKLSNSDSR